MKNKELEKETKNLIEKYVIYLNELCEKNKRVYFYKLYKNNNYEVRRFWDLHSRCNDYIGSFIDAVHCLQILEYEIILEEVNREEKN